MLEYFLTDDIQDWRTDAHDAVEDADTLPGVFGELQTTAAYAEVELTAIELQTMVDETGPESPE